MIALKPDLHTDDAVSPGTVAHCLQKLPRLAGADGRFTGHTCRHVDVPNVGIDPTGSRRGRRC